MFRGCACLTVAAYVLMLLMEARRGRPNMKVLLVWIAPSTLLLVALTLSYWADKLKAKFEERERRRVEAKRALLGKTGWR